MRLLVAVPSYLPGFRYGGPIRSVHGMAQALVARGHRVRVVTTDCDEGVRLPVAVDRPASVDGVEVVHLRRRGPARLRWSPAARARFTAEAAEADVVWVNGLFQLHSSVALRAAARVGTPVVLSPRGMLDTRTLALRGRLRKRAWLAAVDGDLLRAVDAWHLTAEDERRFLPDLAGVRPRGFVVENGVEHEPLGDRWDAVREDVRALLDGSAPTLLFLGRLNWKKGLDRLVEAFARVPAPARLLVAGPDDGAAARLARDVARAGLERRVRLLGPVTGATRAALLERSDLLVLPSYSENFGNVVLEALAAGTPALVTPEVGAAEVLRRYDAGRVVDGDPAALAAALTELLLAPGARATWSAGAARAAADLAWPALAERFEHALLDLVGGTAGATVAAA